MASTIDPGGPCAYRLADDTGACAPPGRQHPFGYDPRTGVVHIPTLTLPRTLSPSKARRVVDAIANGDLLESLPKGVRMSWPTPAACELTRNGVGGEPCPVMRDARSAGDLRTPAP